MKLTSMQKIIAACVAIALVAVAVVALVIVPQFGQLSQLEADRQAAEQQKQQAQALLAQLEQAKGRAAGTQAELLKIGTEMPDSPQLPTLIIELQDMANQSGVELNSLSPAKPVPVAGKNYTEINMQVNCDKARWSDVLDFLRRLRKCTRLLRITSISLARVADTSGSADASAVITHAPATRLTLALAVTAYVIGDNGVITPAPAAPAPATGGTQ